MTDIRRIGFIGLGSMGGDQARELARGPMELAVFDAFPAAMVAFAGRARLATGLADTAHDADVVALCVRDDAQVLDCVNDVLPAMKPGAVLMIHSTVAPATARAIAARGAERSVAVLDAPVTRTEMTKDGPFVFCMTGGDEAVAARVRPVIDAYATDTLHIGATGSAMALKICNNLVSWCEIMIGLETVKVAQAAGVPVDKLMTIMGRNGVMTPPMRGFIGFLTDPGDADRRAFFASQAGIGVKDLSLAESVARDAGAQAAVAGFVRQRIEGELLAICNS